MCRVGFVTRWNPLLQRGRIGIHLFVVWIVLILRVEQFEHHCGRANELLQGLHLGTARLACAALVRATTPGTAWRTRRAAPTLRSLATARMRARPGRGVCIGQRARNVHFSHRTGIARALALAVALQLTGVTRCVRSALRAVMRAVGVLKRAVLVDRGMQRDDVVQQRHFKGGSVVNHPLWHKVS